MQSAGFIFWDFKRRVMSWSGKSPRASTSRKQPIWLHPSACAGRLSIEVLVDEVVWWEEVSRVVEDIRPEFDVETACLDEDELEECMEEEGCIKDIDVDFVVDELFEVEIERRA